MNDEIMIQENQEEMSTSKAELPNHASQSSASVAEKSIVFLVMIMVILLDQVSKMRIEAWLPLNTSFRPFPALGQLFQLSHVSNTGAAFGLFPDSSNIFMIVAIIVSLVIILYNWRLPGGHPLMRVALGLQLGGALGNFVDRLRLGHVTDFLDFGPWPVFNLADLAIVSGVILMAVLLLFESPEREPERSSDEPAREGVEPAEDRVVIWNE